jgi:hypothetical protein
MSEPLENDKHFCLVCHQEMSVTHELLWSEYFCSQPDHHFYYRVSNHRMTTLRVRFGEGDKKMFLKVYYHAGCSEVWSRSRSINRIKINRIIVPDFTDLDKLKNKIKTYLVFG